jgi:uncharacterized membrane protein YfcA
VDAHLVLSLALSGVIGFALGVFGGGGSILAVPMLVYVTRIAPSAAVGMSLAIVGARAWSLAMRTIDEVRCDSRSRSSSGAPAF